MRNPLVGSGSSIACLSLNLLLFSSSHAFLNSGSFRYLDALARRSFTPACHEFDFLRFSTSCCARICSSFSRSFSSSRPPKPKSARVGVVTRARVVGPGRARAARALPPSTMVMMMLMMTCVGVVDKENGSLTESP